MIRQLIIAIIVLVAPFAGIAKPLVADISSYEIRIDTRFSGTELLLFGARNDTGDIVVVIRGPNKEFIVRKKERVAGIWVNTKQETLGTLPDFYAIASSKPLSSIKNYSLFSALGVGNSNLLATVNPTTQHSEFYQAFIAHQAEKKKYQAEPKRVTFLEDTLFKTVIDFPDNLPSGNYTAEVYLFNGGQLVGVQSTPITVVKSGLDAFVYNFAHHFSVLYGLFAILLAAGIGWVASNTFQRF